MDYQTLFDLIENDNDIKFKEITNDIINLSHIRDNYGDSLLSRAAKKNNVELMKYLLEKKCYINFVNYYGASPLYIASLFNCENAVNFLIENFADPRLFSSFTGQKPFEVCTNNNLKIILHKYTQNFEKILNHPNYNYKYRIADHYRTSLFSLIHPNKNFYKNYPIYPLFKIKYNSTDIETFYDILEICKNCDKNYEKFFDPKNNKKFKDCLICESDTINKCKYCNKVLICKDCENNYDSCVLQLLEIHYNNCKSKKYF